MNKIILCEGETDAILLSYYLDKVAGWKFCKKGPADIAIKTDTFEQSANWYQKDANGNIQLVKALDARQRIDGSVALACAYKVLQDKKDQYINLNKEGE